MKISVIIPNYNGENLLGKNLPNVLDAVRDLKEEVEIIISDDNSKDLSVSIINKFIDENKISRVKIILLENPTNKGFASNINRGVERASGDILVLLNTDVIPTKNFLEPIIPHFRDENVFGVGCLDESIENGKIMLRGRGKGKWRRGFLIHSGASVDGKDTLWVAGGSGVFRRSIWDKLGGLDALYNPFYWEDIDLSYRARKSGYKTLFENKSVVRHEHDKGAIRMKYTEKDIKKIAYRNQFIFVWKNADIKTLMLHIFWLPYSLLYVFFKDRLMIIGFFSAVLLIPKIIAKRSLVQKHSVLNDFKVTEVVK